MPGFETVATDVLLGHIQSALIVDDDWPDFPALIGNITDQAELAEIEVAPEVPGDRESALDGGERRDPEQTASEVDPVALLTEEQAEVPEELVPPPLPKGGAGVALYDLQQALLARGVLCAGVRYHSLDQLDDIKQLSLNSDILILDWQLLHDEGRSALEIIKSLRDQGLRFIFIFTGQSQAEQVAAAILDAFGRKDAPAADLVIDHLVISIRNKPHPGGEISGLQVPVDALLDEAAKAFANHYSGLIQMKILDLTNLHRRGLPKILAHFDDELDLPYLLSLVDQERDTDQAGAEFMSILVDDWRAHLLERLSSRKTFQKSTRTAFFGRLSDMARNHTAQALHAHVSRFSGVEVPKWDTIQDAIPNWIGAGAKSDPPHPSSWKSAKMDVARWACLSSCKAPGLLNTDALDPILRLDALFHQQPELPSKLSQGTVLRISDEDRYLICITPGCDAERPASRIENVYSFVEAIPDNLSSAQKLREADDYCVIKVGEKPICLRIKLKPTYSLHIDQPNFTETKTASGELSSGPTPTQVPTTGPAPSEAQVSPTGPQAQTGTTTPPALASPTSLEAQARTKVALTLNATVLSPVATASSVNLRPVAQLRNTFALAVTARASAQANKVALDRVEFVRKQLERN